ncbi:MAG: TPM domain-containing protein [Spirosomataceae bacterium]
MLTKSQEKILVESIQKAELHTSGEIKVHIEATCEIDPMERAKAIFEHLGLQKTELKNAVLIYWAYQSRKFAILGDSGINQVVSSNFWDSTKETMRTFFQKDQFVEGIAAAVTEAGYQLKTFFPYDSNDVNEISDDISMG